MATTRRTDERNAFQTLHEHEEFADLSRSQQYAVAAAFLEDWYGRRDVPMSQLADEWVTTGAIYADYVAAARESGNGTRLTEQRAEERRLALALQDVLGRIPVPSLGDTRQAARSLAEAVIAGTRRRDSTDLSLTPEQAHSLAKLLALTLADKAVFIRNKDRVSLEAVLILLPGGKHRFADAAYGMPYCGTCGGSRDGDQHI
jgi:hypothetical protein